MDVYRASLVAAVLVATLALRRIMQASQLHGENSNMQGSQMFELKEEKRGGEDQPQEPSDFTKEVLNPLQHLEEKNGLETMWEGEQAEENKDGKMSLEACDLRELIESKQREYFEGTREWLFKDIKAWLAREPERLCWLVGGAGTGKSVASAQLLITEGLQEHIKAWHFCRHDNAAGSDVRVILQSWAAMLTAGLEGFEVADVGKALAAPDVSEMFQLLIAEPFKNLAKEIGHGGSGCSHFPLACPSPCVILLDAVDELPRGNLNHMLRLLAEEFDGLPTFVRLLVVSRDEATVHSRLKKFSQVKLEVDELRNRVDLREYLTNVARRHVSLELSIRDMEVQLEREFGLPLFRLRGELQGLDASFRRCKDVYAVAFSELDEAAFRDVCKIREIRPSPLSPLKQWSSDLDQLYLDAEEAHEILKSLLTKLAKGCLVDPGLKNRDSALRKIRTECSGDASRVKDLARFTVVFQDCLQMKQFVEGLLGEEQKEPDWAQDVKMFSLKNKFSNPSPLGHRDLNLTLGVKLASGNVHFCEVQVNLKVMKKAANLTHEFYEKVRVEVPRVCDRAGVKDAEKFKASLSKLLRSSALEVAVRDLERKAGGLFLYAGLLARHLETLKRKVNFAELQGLPNGLSEIYELNFGRMVHSREQWARYSQLIALIIAAREPLPVGLARELVGGGCEDMEQDLSLLFPVREDRFNVMHKSVADWLQDRESMYQITTEDMRSAHQQMGRYFLQFCLQPAAAPEEMMVRHVVEHLCLAGLWAEAYQVASDLDWLLTRAEMDPVELVRNLELAASFSASPHSPTIALMGQALRMDLEELRRDYLTLPGCLVGRLIGYEAPEVQQLLVKLRKWSGPPRGWWCPLQPSLVPAGGALSAILQLPERVNRIQHNPGDANQLAIACGRVVYIYDHEDCIHSLGEHSYETSMSWSSDGRLCTGCDQKVRVWDMATGQCVKTLKEHSSRVTSVSWSKDGKICSGGWDCIRVWEEKSSGDWILSHEFNPPGLIASVTSVAWSNDGRICSGSKDGIVRVWDVSSHVRCVHSFTHAITEPFPSSYHPVDVEVSWSNDGRICSHGGDVIRIWNVSSGACTLTLNTLAAAVSWSPDGKICSGSGQEVHVWDVSNGKCIETLLHNGPVRSVSWGSDGRILSDGDDKTVRIWDLSKNKFLNISQGHSAGVRELDWSNDGRICSGSCGDTTVRVWEVASGKCVKTLRGHSRGISALSWSWDGRICSGSYDATIRLWEVSSGKCTQILEGHSTTVAAVAWCSDATLICSSGDHTLRIWDVSSGQCLLQLLNDKSTCTTSVSWSADDSLINVCDSCNVVRVWKPSSGECIRTFKKPYPSRLADLPVGFDQLYISLCPTNPNLAIAVNINTIHCLARRGLGLRLLHRKKRNKPRLRRAPPKPLGRAPRSFL